jgi:hypothetical protein
VTVLPPLPPVCQHPAGTASGHGWHALVRVLPCP